MRPTIFTNVRNDMAIAREEIFGPVLCMLSYRDVEDAISIANDTIYGLAAYVQSATDARAEEVAARLETGLVFINGADEDFEAPFGGYRCPAMVESGARSPSATSWKPRLSSIVRRPDESSSGRRIRRSGESRVLADPQPGAREGGS